MIRKILIPILILASLWGCSEDYNPKPRGYYRIDLPEKAYKPFEQDCPYTFEYPVYASIEKYKRNDSVECWNNVVYHRFGAQLYMSYFKLDGNLNRHIEDSRSLTYTHTVKADGINEVVYNNSDKKAYGLYYKLKGDAASQIQFYLTDSVNHFLRGGLYFNTAPNSDSLAPVLDFIAEDITHMIETLEWR
ncbi:MAG: gliding motility lipoprotein GldD [Flavobacteriales bacterium]|nr:gliding motility lipoprotein GldD [Flavobacteriales bacterium]